MSTNFPNALDDNTNLPNPSGSDLLTNPNPVLQHAYQHDTLNDALKALQAKIGVNGSADVTSLDYKVRQPASSGGVQLVSALPALSAAIRGKLYLLESAPYGGPSYDSVVEADTTLAAYYKLDDLASTNSAIDFKGGKSGILNAGVTPHSLGGLSDSSPSMKFDGLSGAIDIASPQTFASGNFTAFCIEGWVNWSGSASPGCWFSMGEGGQGYALTIDSTGLLKHGFGQTAIDGAASLGYTLLPNTWYHLAYNQSSSGTQLFVNGVANQPPIPGRVGALVDYTNWLIGWYQYYGYFWTGSIEKIALYTVPLSLTEIQNHYAVGSAKSTNDELYLGFQKADNTFGLRHLLGG